MKAADRKAYREAGTGLKVQLVVRAYKRGWIE